MTRATPEELIAMIRGSEFDGADAITVDLCRLRGEFRNKESLQRIINSTMLPVMVVFYRNDTLHLTKTDEERQEILLAAAEAGASVIDVMGDLYDPSPREFTTNPEAIARQRELIARIHEKGAQVVMSSHMYEPRTPEDILAHLKEFERRGADILKIVTLADTEEDMLNAVRTMMLLRRERAKPYIFLCNGRYGRFLRFVGESLGVAITLGVYRYQVEMPQPQPTVSAMKTVFENMRFHVDSVDPVDPEKRGAGG